MKAPRLIKFQVFLGILLFTAVVANAATAVLPAEPDPGLSLETHLKTKFSRMSVLPGLFDSHFHSRFTIKTPVEYELKRGITSFRDPGHPFKCYSTVMESKETLPRVFLCGGHLDGPPPVWADLVLIKGDPSRDIGAMRNVERVMLNGSWIDKAR